MTPTWLLLLSVAGASAGCSGDSKKPAPPPVQGRAEPPAAGSGSAVSGDPCPGAVDRVYALLARKGVTADPAGRDGAIAECRANPTDPVVACVVAATTDLAVENCVMPVVGAAAPKGEPYDQLEAATENLRTYFFVHETFTTQKVALTPAKPCCTFSTKMCPPEAKPDRILTDILKLDLSTERGFQYRFESTGNKAVVEAIGDRDCDGKTITYRRDLERRADGNMHVTVTDPPDGSD